MTFKKSILASLLVAVLVFTTGCSAEGVVDEGVENDSTNEVADEMYPITVQHAFGETVIEKKPESVATIAWGNHDVPLALGVIPTGVSMANYGVTDESGLLPWTKQGFTNLGEENPVVFNDLTGLDYEAINASEPDVILAAYSGITQEEYDLLSEIAPVVAYPETAWTTLWRDQIEMNSKAMGLETEGQELIEELETLIEEKSSAYTELEGKAAAFVWFSPTDLGSFYVYTTADPRAAYLTDFGMVESESIRAASEASGSFYLTISAENVDILNDVDIILTYGNEELLDILQADPLVGTIPAVKNGAVAVVPDNTPLAASGTPSALSIPATIDEYLELIASAAKNVQ